MPIRLIWLLGAVLAAGEDRVLFERGTRLLDAGEWERGRIALATLVNAYPKSVLRGAAEESLRASVRREEAARLFQAGLAKLAAGKREAALLTFETLVRVYPESEFARLARELL